MVRIVAFNKFLKAQRTCNTSVMDDDDVCKAVEKMEAEELRRSILNQDHHRNQPKK